MDFDLFVIGGGSGGVRAARIAAGYGASVGIAEERFWGGTCVNVGCVPKKLFVQASEYGAYAEDARGFGWRSARPVHDWPALVAAKDREIARLSGSYRGLLEKAGVRLFEAPTRFLDPHTLMVGEQRISAERIVIATGAHPARLAIPGAELGIVSDDAFFLKSFPRRIAIIGSGYIAVEFAGIFAGLGAETHLVYRQPLPLRGFDPDLRAALAEALAAQNITLHPSVHPLHIESEGGQRVLQLDHGAGLHVDVVFFATGRAANTARLNLAAASVATDARGAVLVDREFRTNQPHIFAIGDVIGGKQLTPVATAEGHALAQALYGPGPRPYNFSAIPTAVFTTPPIATVGLGEAEAAARGVTQVYLTKFTPMRHHLTGRKRQTLMKLVVSAADGRLQGVHMLGEDAPEIVQGLAVALTAGVTKADFDRTIGIHPTAAEEFVTMRTLTRTVDIARAAE